MRERGAAVRPHVGVLAVLFDHLCGHAEDVVDDAELLVELVKDYFEARDARMSAELKRLLKRRKRGRASGEELAAFELLRYDDSPAREVTDRQWPRHTLRVLVEPVAEIWREHGGTGAGSFYSDSKQRHDGPLIRLLHELFTQAGIPEERWPGTHSLHNEIRHVAR